MTSIGRPRSAVASAESRNLECDEIAIELLRADRHARTLARTLGQGLRARGDVVDKPMRERTRKIELRWQVGIDHGKRETPRPLWNARPHKRRRNLIFLNKSSGHDRARRN